MNEIAALTKSLKYHIVNILKDYILTIVLFINTLINECSVK